MAEGTLLPLFKFWSMNGSTVFRNGGPIDWLGERQDRTSLSSCKAEIRATSATSKKVVNFRNLCKSVSESGLPIPGMGQTWVGHFVTSITLPKVILSYLSTYNER